MNSVAEACGGASPTSPFAWRSWDGTVLADLTYDQADGYVAIEAWTSDQPGRGNTRRALLELREAVGESGTIVVSGIGMEPAEPSYRYWTKMFGEGLVDVLTDDDGKEVASRDRREVSATQMGEDVPGRTKVPDMSESNGATTDQAATSLHGMTNKRLLGLVGVGFVVSEAQSPALHARSLAAAAEIARRYEGTDLDPRTHVWQEPTHEGAERESVRSLEPEREI